MAEVSERERRRELRRARRREEILEAAARLLEQGGPGTLSAEALAAEVNLSAGSLYHYFPSLEAITDALALRLLRAEGEALLEAAQGADTALEALQALVRAKFRLYAEEPRSFELLYTAVARLALSPRLLEEELMPANERLFGGLAQRVAEDQAAGRITTALHPRLLVNLCWSLAQGLLMQAMAARAAGSGTRFPLELSAEQACLLVERACRA